MIRQNLFVLYFRLAFNPKSAGVKTDSGNSTSDLLLQVVSPKQSKLDAG